MRAGPEKLPGHIAAACWVLKWAAGLPFASQCPALGLRGGVQQAWASESEVGSPASGPQQTPQASVNHLGSQSLSVSKHLFLIGVALHNALHMICIIPSTHHPNLPGTLLPTLFVFPLDALTPVPSSNTLTHPQNLSSRFDFSLSLPLFRRAGVRLHELKFSWGNLDLWVGPRDMTEEGIPL